MPEHAAGTRHDRARLARRRTLHASCKAGLLAAALVFALAADGSASALGVVNPGFEDISGESPYNEFTFGPLSGWALYDPASISSGGSGPTYYLGTLTPVESDPVGNPGVHEFFPDGASEGQRVGIAFSFTGSGGQGEWGFEQEIADTLQAQTLYTLRVQVGNIASGTSVGNQFFDLDGFPGYRVELLAGDVVIAQDDNTLAGSIPEGEFAESVVELTTGASHPQLGEALGIRLVNLNLVDPADPGADLEVDFDDVRLDAVAAFVPSVPVAHSTRILLALAVLGAGAAGLRSAALRSVPPGGASTR